jgi:hypothetical protein
MLDCDAAVKALEPKDGMMFESNGQTESDAQRRGRKLRDEVYDKYHHLFFEPPKHSWGKLSDEMKTEIANALGKKPLNWCPSITGRRMTNHINTTRSRLNAKKRQMEDNDSDGSAISVFMCIMLTLCHHVYTRLTYCHTMPCRYLPHLPHPPHPPHLPHQKQARKGNM